MAPAKSRKGSSPEGTDGLLAAARLSGATGGIGEIFDCLPISAAAAVSQLPKHDPVNQPSQLSGDGSFPLALPATRHGRRRMAALVNSRAAVRLLGPVSLRGDAQRGSRGVLMTWACRTARAAGGHSTCGASPSAHKRCVRALTQVSTRFTMLWLRPESALAARPGKKGAPNLPDSSES